VGIASAASTPTSQKDSVRRCGCAINKALPSFCALEPSTVIAPRDIQKRGLRASDHASPAESGRAECYWKGLPKSGYVVFLFGTFAGFPVLSRLFILYAARSRTYCTRYDKEDVTVI
jgi:hypothetical protein